jgi:DNA helicase-2/ATP-dependent DNA helicase PcrA
MTTVTKLIGAPGSGKTTKLLEFCEREANKYDTGCGQLMFCTFSGSAQQEVTERFTDVYPDEEFEDLKKRVRTVHSASLVACLVDGGLNLRDNPEADGQLLIRRGNERGGDSELGYAEYFFKSRFPRVQYDPSANDPIKELESGESTDIPDGNRVLALYDYLKSKHWPLDEYYRAPFFDDIDLPPRTIHSILEGWEEYKTENDLMEDIDYVEMALHENCVPPTDVLLIDEFQDLSPLQCDLYEQWRDSGALDRLYIAGDVHQAIYGFRGAEPSYFRDTPADEVIHHEESKRCREAIVDAAVPIAAPPAEHDVSRVSAWRSGGSVAHVDARGPDALGDLVTRGLVDHDEVYLLARTNRQAAKLANGLRESGIPYLGLKPDGYFRRWKHPMPMLLAALRTFNQGRNLPVPVANELLRCASKAPAREEAMEAAKEGRATPESTLSRAFSAEEVGAWFPNASRARDIIPQLDLREWRRELLTGALRSGATNDPSDVRIGTIHAAKGLEAPCVFVFPAYSRAQLDRFQNGAEAEERRLYYVALTRASDTVRVVHDYFGGKEFPPLEAA